MPHQDSSKTYTCFQMEGMSNKVQSLLNKDDVVGYVAARNIRVLQNELEDYLVMKNKFITELGSDELDENGNPTGNVSIKVGTEQFDKFMEKMKPIGETTSNPSIFKLDAEECIDKLTGMQMLEFEWMIDFNDGGEDS